MRRRNLAFAFVFLTGCHGPADNFAKLDVADPPLTSGWVQFRHEPGGYAFQAPASWMVDPQGDAQAVIARTGNDVNLFINLIDREAVRNGDRVSFAVTRMALPGQKELKVTNLDALAKTALQAMTANTPDAKHERLELAIGPAEHIWGVMEGTMADGSRGSVTTHLVVFATALRPFVLMYGYPTNKEATYRPTLDAMARTLRLILPQKDGKIEIPASARAPQPSSPGFSGSVNPNSTPPTPSTPPVSTLPPSGPPPTNPYPEEPAPPATDPNGFPTPPNGTEPPGNGWEGAPAGGNVGNGSGTTGDPNAAPPPSNP